MSEPLVTRTVVLSNLTPEQMAVVSANKAFIARQIEREMIALHQAEMDRIEREFLYGTGTTEPRGIFG